VLDVVSAAILGGVAAENVLLTCRRRYPKNYQKSDELS
jgi:hypothetical protein